MVEENMNDIPTLLGFEREVSPSPTLGSSFEEESSDWRTQYESSEGDSINVNADMEWNHPGLLPFCPQGVSRATPSEDPAGPFHQGDTIAGMMQAQADLIIEDMGCHVNAAVGEALQSQARGNFLDQALAESKARLQVVFNSHAQAMERITALTGKLRTRFHPKEVAPTLRE
ncbi:hypothetical protein Nepgr_028096 [Nepenthes gracilis]|uniref:Uncharacterized protein n=1 Tax=Nepenthes gracilis TaxID=150966 RepID=A0AAD3TA06_NEPGR|nr:hypothetical protein Nepgr_028096 [Nepenthes gracilis]